MCFLIGPPTVTWSSNEFYLHRAIFSLVNLNRRARLHVYRLDPRWICSTMYGACVDSIDGSNYLVDKDGQLTIFTIGQTQPPKPKCIYFWNYRYSNTLILKLPRKRHYYLSQCGWLLWTETANIVCKYTLCKENAIKLQKKYTSTVLLLSQAIHVL